MKFLSLPAIIALAALLTPGLMAQTTVRVARGTRWACLCSSESVSATYGCPIKCQSRRISGGPNSASVSTGFNARERGLGAK